MLTFNSFVLRLDLLDMDAMAFSGLLTHALKGKQLHDKRHESRFAFSLFFLRQGPLLNKHGGGNHGY